MAPTQLMQHMSKLGTDNIVEEDWGGDTHRTKDRDEDVQSEVQIKWGSTAELRL